MSFEVTIEPVIENKIQEVTLDGQEIYVQPLSLSENLTKLAQKIDFSRDESEDKGGLSTSEGVKSKEETAAVIPQPLTWPWESVRNKLKQALTEVGVLLDVLAVTREKKYLVLDPILLENVEPKLATTILPKKRSLQAAGNILIDGADRLRKGLEGSSSLSGKSSDFYSELVKIRQRWRIKKVGNNIIGDLGYKSAGSRYQQNATFEVAKAETADSDAAVVASVPRSAIDVTVPGELEGFSYLHVSCRNTGSADLAGAMREPALERWDSTTGVGHLHWQPQLEAAQNVIFCKELFAQLAHEAMQLSSGIPHVVIGNHILCHLFPGVQLSVYLSHQTKKNAAQLATRGAHVALPPLQPCAGLGGGHSVVMEHSLHQLLREHHHVSSCLATPHPITASFATNKRRRLAGPLAYSQHDLSDCSPARESILAQIIRQAQHAYAVRKIVALLDDLSKSTKDVLVMVNASSLSSGVDTVLRLTLSSVRYDVATSRTILHLHVVGNKILVSFDGGRSRRAELPFEEEDLRDFVNLQIAQHIATAVVQMARGLGWRCAALNAATAVSHATGPGLASNILLQSPSGAVDVSVNVSPAGSGVKVRVRRRGQQQEQDAATPSLIADSHWLAVSAAWQELHLDCVEGWSPVQKLEYVLATLSE